jgi:ATP-binding cassette subfamily C exporter for protease/lipase
VRGLVATAPGRPAPILHGIDLEIHAGQTLVVLGPSGSGKSTLARCLVGIWPDTQGEVLLDGEPLAAWTREALGPHIGYLPQDVELFDGTIADNIARMARPDPDKVIAAARATGLHDAILRLPKGYDSPIGEAGGVLSGGQRQRLALARALLRRPRLLLLDDATSAVDPRVEQAILTGLRGTADATTVVVAHRVSTIALADRVLLLDDGRIAAVGTHQELLDHPAYAALVRAYESTDAGEDEEDVA